MTDLQDGRKTDRSQMESIRLESIDRWVAGEKPLDIIRGTNYCETTIYKWIGIFQKFGREGLISKKAPGASARLSDEAKRKLKEMIVGHEPTAYGFESSLWTRKIVAELVKEHFNVKLGLTQIGKILSELKITPQKPTRESREQDPEEVKEWKEEKLPRILNSAREANAELFFWDEAGYRLDDQIGRTWGACGKTPVVKCTGKRSRTNSAIAISMNGAFWCTQFNGNMNSDKFCEILDEFMETRKRDVIIIMDKHPTHTSKRTKMHFASYGSKLTVHMLPGYSPELNPVEYVNNYVKKIGPRKILPKDIDDLVEIVDCTLSKLRGAYKLVKSFFNHKKLDGIFT